MRHINTINFTHTHTCIYACILRSYSYRLIRYVSDILESRVFECFNNIVFVVKFVLGSDFSYYFLADTVYQQMIVTNTKGTHTHTPVSSLYTHRLYLVSEKKENKYKYTIYIFRFCCCFFFYQVNDKSIMPHRHNIFSKT